MIEKPPEEPDTAPESPEGELAPPPSMQDLERAGELVEVFRVDNDFAVGAVIDEILAPAGIEAFRHDRRSHALPMPFTLSGEVGVAVDRSVAARARELLREARADGALPGDGEIVDDETAGD